MSEPKEPKQNKIDLIKKIIFENFGLDQFEDAQAEFKAASNGSPFSSILMSAYTGKRSGATPEELWIGILNRKCGNHFQTIIINDLNTKLGEFKRLDQNGVTYISDPVGFCRRNNITNLQEFIAKHMDVIQPHLSQEEIDEMIKQLTIYYDNEQRDSNWTRLLPLIRKWIEDFLFDISLKRFKSVLEKI